MNYSLIIPVYNRPDELHDLLRSITEQTYTDFEVIVIEDGSAISSQEVVKTFEQQITIQYHTQLNLGPGASRNVGATLAHGEYLIILDSDVTLPANYLQLIHDYLAKNPVDAFGGPDRSHPDFSPIQRAISYAMTSFFTTGGIRGGSTNSLDKFYPRSYNMGIRKEVFEALDGFSTMRYGEDIDFSLRIIEANYHTALISEAWVYHKRRSTFKQFFNQVVHSGVARIELMKRHPGSLKAVHMLPSLFTLGASTLALMALLAILRFNPIGVFVILSPLAFYGFILWIDATIKENSIWVGFLAIFASFIQLIGYGSGLIKTCYRRLTAGENLWDDFKANFSL